MQKTFSASKTQLDLVKDATLRVAQAQRDLATLYAGVLAQHDVTAGQVVAVTAEGIVVDLPELESAEPSDSTSEKP